MNTSEPHLEASWSGPLHDLHMRVDDGRLTVDLAIDGEGGLISIHCEQVSEFSTKALGSIPLHIEVWNVRCHQWDGIEFHLKDSHAGLEFYCARYRAISWRA